MAQANTTDFLIIGAGIVGLALARELKQRYPDQRVRILEKEPTLGQHASGRNSGVLHSGIYYPPGSLKAQVCSQGARELTQFCEDRQLPVIRPGKLLVPTDPTHGHQLNLLEDRAGAHGIAVQRIDEATLATIEPEIRSATGEALLVPTTAVIQPKRILDSLVQDLNASGVEIHCGGVLQQIDAKHRTIQWNQNRLAYGHAINCAGAHADVIAHRFGAGQRYTLLPFRGSYWQLDPRSGIRLHHLIYPVPDLRIPFLGIHTTTSVEGDLYLGPTATPALARENYSGLQGSHPKEILRITGLLARQFIAGHDGFRRLAWRESRHATRSGFTAAARALLPRLRAEHLRPAPKKTGIRAQLMDQVTGRLVMDFLVEQSPGATHVLNAISPAFTSAFPLARHLITTFIEPRH